MKRRYISPAQDVMMCASASIICTSDNIKVDTDTPANPDPDETLVKENNIWDNEW